MAIVFVPFDGWAPSGSLYGEGWQTVQNLFPAFNSWRPWRRMEPVGASVAFGPMVGGHAHLWMAGAGGSSYQPDSVTLFTGSKTRLFSVDPVAGGFTDVSRAALYGAGVGTEPAGWRFASVGNDVWAVNWFDVPQRRVANAGLFTNGIVSTFVPVARHIAVIREHLTLANLSNVGRFQDEFVWSDADDATNFDPPTGTSISIAGSKRLVSTPGQITALIGGQYGLAFKRRSIYYLEYAGGTQVFRPEVLSSHIGTAYGSSVISSRYGVFFWGGDGFYQMTGLAEPQKISSAGVDRALFLDGLPLVAPGTATAQGEDNIIVGFQSPSFPLVGWLYSRSWGDPGEAIILYNPFTQQWSTADVEPSPPLSWIMSLPYAASLYESIIGFSYEPTTSKLRALSPLSVDAWEPSMTLRYRPANLTEDGDKTTAQFRQSIIKGVLPVFSRDSPFPADELHPGVTVKAILHPYQAAETATETRVYTDRNVISGFYPFQIAGRMFQISISGNSSEDFANFEGVFIEQEVLS